IQTTTYLDLDSLRAKPQRLFHGLSHRTAKRNALLELRRNLLRLQLRIELRLVNLLNRHQDFASGLRRKITLELIDLRALATDDDSGPRRVDDDLEAISGSFDIDVRHTGSGKASLQILLQLQILEQKLAELLLRKPMRMPVLVVAESKTVWMNFLTHNLLQSLLFSAFFFTLRLLLRGLLSRSLLGGLGLFLLRHPLCARRRCSATTFPALALSELCRLRFRVVLLLRALGRTLVVAQRNRHVTEVSLLSIGTTLRCRSHATHVLRWSNIYKRGSHPQVVGIDRDVRLFGG